MAPKVLISDQISPAAVRILTDRGIDVTYEPDLGRDRERLAAVIGAFDGLAIRSATRVTPRILAAAARLKVIGRAGLGLDNVDVPAATAHGVIVMNTPFGNSITTAEHAIAMLFAVARQIPAADASTQAGRWEKNRFMGVELASKTLGIVGCGTIGALVSERALGLKMKVVAFDPFLSAERALDLGVEKVDFDTLLARADFISLHTPLTDRTRNILDAQAIGRAKDGVYIINCARGGLVDEAALRAALESGKVAGAAFDVFSAEPATDNVLFGAPNMVCTPHLGAATTEAQENVALQVAGQIADYLLGGAVTNAVNMPSISAEEAPKLAPFARLAGQLGFFAGQLAESSLTGVRVEFEGAVAGMNVKALTAAALAGLFRPLLQTVNIVSAPAIARERGIRIEEVRRDAQGSHESIVKLTVETDRDEHPVAGTVFADDRPRIIEIGGVQVDAAIAPHMLYIASEDKPGFVGALGTVLGEAGINIATFSLGRRAAGGEAVCLAEVDGPVPPAVLARIAGLPLVRQARVLAF